MRKLSFDELPQLFNILAGDMSFVGPRPEMPFIVNTYNDMQLRRIKVIPGLTGPWQISKDREFAIHENIHHDLGYLKNRSFVYDMKIFLSTPFAIMLNSKGAK